jgi:CheY-like chemotaxis protein
MAGELILIIDDIAESRLLVNDVLTYNGYRLIEADRAETGVLLARERRPALILMDIRLPGIDGYAALDALRADPGTHDIPVIAVTASAMTDERSRIAGAGFDGYQDKPIDITRLVEAVRTLLARQPRAATS